MSLGNYYAISSYSQTYFVDNIHVKALLRAIDFLRSLKYSISETHRYAMLIAAPPSVHRHIEKEGEKKKRKAGTVGVTPGGRDKLVDLCRAAVNFLRTEGKSTKPGCQIFNSHIGIDQGHLYMI